jgi:hypothetical protein
MMSVYYNLYQFFVQYSVCKKFIRFTLSFMIDRSYIRTTERMVEEISYGQSISSTLHPPPPLFFICETVPVSMLVSRLSR